MKAYLTPELAAQKARQMSDLREPEVVWNGNIL